MAGNNIQTKCSPVHELFQDVVATPTSLTAVRAALAAGALRGQSASVRDAQSAYLQAPLKEFNPDGSRKPSQWLRLPKSVWPKSWFDAKTGEPLYRDPVVRLKKALYGLRIAPSAWQRHFAEVMMEMTLLRSMYDANVYYGKGIWGICPCRRLDNIGQANYCDQIQ